MVKVDYKERLRQEYGVINVQNWLDEIAKARGDGKFPKAVTEQQFYVALRIYGGFDKDKPSNNNVLIKLGSSIDNVLGMAQSSFQKKLDEIVNEIEKKEADAPLGKITYSENLKSELKERNKLTQDDEFVTAINSIYVTNLTRLLSTKTVFTGEQSTDIEKEKLEEELKGFFGGIPRTPENITFDKLRSFGTLLYNKYVLKLEKKSE